MLKFFYSLFKGGYLILGLLFFMGESPFCRAEFVLEFFQFVLEFFDVGLFELD